MHQKRTAANSPYSKKQKLIMLLWWTVEIIIYRNIPHKLNKFRCLILKIFGAKIGDNTFISRTAKIWFPWNLSIGKNSGIGFDALIYNLANIDIGDFTTISQRSHINTGTHDYNKNDFPLITKPVKIGDNVFIGADSYVNLGITIGDGAVIGARSVVTKDMPTNYICVGHPCKPIKLIRQPN